MTAMQADAGIILAAPTSSSSRAALIAYANRQFQTRGIACKRIFIDNEDEISRWPESALVILPLDDITDGSRLAELAHHHILIGLISDKTANNITDDSLQSYLHESGFTDIVTEADLDSPTVKARLHLWQTEKARLAPSQTISTSPASPDKTAPKTQEGMVEYSFALLDHIVPGVLLATADLRLIHANASGKAFLAASRYFDLDSENGLHPKDASISRAIQVLKDNKGDTGTETVASFDEDGIVMHFTPVGRDAARAGIAIFICQRNQMIHLDPARLQSVYGFSASEARLALALLNGDTLPDLARSWALSQNTLRSQLKNILQKSGARRQSDLIKIILTGPATLTKQRA